MSEIPFVTQLGDAFDDAMAAERARSRRRRPRRTLVAVAAVLLTAGSGVAIAELLADPTEQAVTGVSCSQTPSLDKGVAVVWAGERSPEEACAKALERPPAALVACEAREGIVVFPGAGARACARAGLRPATPQYAAERERVAELERELIALEDRADCVEPREFARQVDALLERMGWTGWRTWLRDDIDTGPCGSVSGYGGDGRRTIAGALDPGGLRVMVFAAASRSLEELLIREGGALMDASADRCADPADLRELTRRRLGGTGREIGYTVSEPENGVQVDGPRGDRLAEGCAVIVGVGPSRDGFGIDVQIWQAG
jgi:hypothetical protein